MGPSSLLWPIFIFLLCCLCIMSMASVAGLQALTVDVRKVLEEVMTDFSARSAEEPLSKEEETSRNYHIRLLFASTDFMVLAHRAMHNMTLGADAAQELRQAVEDFGSGTHRADTSVEQCQNNDATVGGRAAVLGDACNYASWLDLRKPILTYFLEKGELAAQRFRDAVSDLSVHYHESKNDESFHTFFRTLCVQCTGHPLLQCNEGTGKCECWDDYTIDPAAPSTFELRCRTKIGGICDEFSGAKCVPNAFCNQDYKCECLENGQPCLGSGNLGRFQGGSLAKLLAIELFAVMIMLLAL